MEVLGGTNATAATMVVEEATLARLRDEGLERDKKGKRPPNSHTGGRLK